MPDHPKSLTEQQDALFDRFLASTEYSSALQLLDEHRPLVDDLFLTHLAAMSQRLYTQANYVSAASIADIGTLLDDLASVPTKIDLRIAAGQAFARLPNWREGSVHAYRTAIEEAEAADTPYMVPLAKVMLGQFARVDGRIDEARVLLRAAAVGALDPSSGVEPEVFWNALKLYMRLPTLDSQISSRESVAAALALLPKHLLGEFRTRFNLKVSETELLETWAEAKASASVVVDGVDPYDEDTLLPFSRAIYKSFAKREDRDSGPAPRRATRYSTNVLTDRVITQYPYFSTYVTRHALAGHLESLSILSHEFTHYWTFLGSLGGYFSVVALELRLLSEFVSKASALEQVGADPARCVAAFHDERIKMRMLWEVWRPWAEGLALFAEMDLDLRESGTMALPLTVFLACLPASDTILDDDGETQPRPASADPVGQFVEIEELQSKARVRVLPLYRWSVYFGKTGEGNERCYFTGHGLVSALWRRWAEREPAFANSVSFFTVLLWLSHSAFDDLIPDWRLPKDAFADTLIRLSDGFLRRLFAAPTDRLAELAKVTLDSQSAPAKYDLWRYLQDGDRDGDAAAMWETRTTAIVRELAEAAFGDVGPAYVDFLSQERRAILDGVLNASHVHMLSQSQCEIRLVHEPPTLICVARSVHGGPASLLVIQLTRQELDSLAAEARGRNDGAAELHQFVLARSHSTVGRTYVFPVGVRYGQTFVVLSRLFRAGQGTVRVEDADLALLRHFLDPGVQAARHDMALVVDTADEPAAAALLERFADRVDRLYLGAFISGPPEWMERLRNERLRAFFPTSGAERARTQDALDLVTRELLSMTDGELATRMGVSPEEVTSAIVRFTESAGVLGQDPIVRQGDRIRFAGLRASI